MYASLGLNELIHGREYRIQSELICINIMIMIINYHTWIQIQSVFVCEVGGNPKGIMNKYINNKLTNKFSSLPTPP